MGNMRPRVTVLVGGGLMVLGSLLLWVAVDIGIAQFSRDGIELTEGKVTVIAGGVAVLAGLALTGTGALGWLSSVVALGASVVGGIALLTEYLDVMQRIAETDPSTAQATVGIGIWVTAAGVIIAFVGAIWSLAAQRANRSVATIGSLDEAVS